MKPPSDRRTIAISKPTLERLTDGRWRVAARVGRDEVELVADSPLVSNADAFVAAFLLPAAKVGATLAIDADIDARLLGNLDAIQAIARRDWGFPGARVVPRGTVTRTPAGGSSLFFTGGVDSFFTLHRHRDSIDRIIYVDGFDLSLEEPARFAMVRTGIEAVARETGLDAAFPRTNLRRNPIFQRLGWERSFGSAMAAVSHLMAPTASTVWIASSTMHSNYGSTTELDPLWGSGAVDFLHDGVELFRPAKIRAIADWPLVHRHLRVCYSRAATGLNCGVCEKCARTQASLAAVGVLDRIETFPKRPLPAIIDGVEYARPINHDSWADIRDQSPDAAVVAAIDRLLRRRQRPGNRLRAALAPWVNPWLDRAPGGGAIRAFGKRLLSG